MRDDYYFAHRWLRHYGAIPYGHFVPWGVWQAAARAIGREFRVDPTCGWR